MPSKLAVLSTILLTVLLTTGCAPGTETLRIGHVQGLSYSLDGKTLYLTTDASQLQYTKATGWSKKTTNGGKSTEQLALQGMNVDLVATALHTGTIYVWMNHSQKPLEQGLSYTKDGGKTWTHVKAAGLDGEIPLCLGVNPDDDRWVAIGTANGLIFSDDQGETFDLGYPQLNDTRVTAVSFDTHNPDIPLVGAHSHGSPQALSAPFSVKLFKSTFKSGPTFFQQDFKSLFKINSDDEITQLINNPAGDGYVASTRKGDVLYMDPAHHVQDILITKGIVHFGLPQ